MSAAVDMLNKVRVKAMLIGDRRVGAFDINVEVRGKIAILRGEVESEEQKYIAEELAREIQAIDEVDNELEVNPALLERDWNELYGNYNTD